MSALYRQLPLPERNRFIRVLDLELSSTEFSEYGNERLQGQLRCVSLDDDPQFAALSYVWGAYATTPDYLFCNDGQLEVTENCYSALLHLRKKFGALTIWVDSICIDQSNKLEKEQQISMMGDIYSRAYSTFVWLGDGTAGTDRAMAYLGSVQIQRYYKTSPEGQDVSRSFTAAWYICFAEWNPWRQAVPSYGTQTCHATDVFFWGTKANIRIKGVE